MSLVSCAECGKQISTSATSCPHCGAPSSIAHPKAPPSPPKPAQPTSGRSRTFTIVASAALFAVAAYFVVAAQFVNKEPSLSSQLKERCVAGKAARTAEFESLMKEGKFDDAWTLAFDCVAADEAHYAGLRNRATVAVDLEKLKAAKLSPEERLKIIEELRELAPDLAKPFEGEIAGLRDSAARERAADEAAARYRHRDPYIGMKRSEAEYLTWGRPSTINTDTSARGVTEQWVFDKRGYLYFRNGVLETIQERP